MEEPEQANPTTISLKVLIVEDDEQIQKMYATMFGFRKYDVQVAIDGIEGVAKAKQFQPDVVLLDIMMPRMNGIEALDALKADPETKNIPVIMLSNIANEGDITNALNHGAIKYIIKSEYIPRQVADMVEEAILGDKPIAATAT